MATYGGGTNVTSFIQTTNSTVNGASTVAYTTPAGRYSQVRLLSFSLPSGTSVTAGTAVITFQSDSGLGGWVDHASYTIPFGLSPGNAGAIAISGIAGQLSDGSFVMPYGTRIQVNAGTGGGGTGRFQMSVTEYFSSN